MGTRAKAVLVADTLVSLLCDSAEEDAGSWKDLGMVLVTATATATASAMEVVFSLVIASLLAFCRESGLW